MDSADDASKNAYSVDGENYSESDEANIHHIPETYYERFCLKNGKQQLRYKMVVRVIPVVNAIYDLFFDGSRASVDGVQNLLNVIALINALLLGGVLAEVTAPGYDDLLAADARYTGFNGTLANEEGELYPKYWTSWYRLKPSEQLYTYSSNSLTLLFVGIVVVIYIFVDGLSKQENLKDEDTNAIVDKMQKRCSSIRLDKIWKALGPKKIQLLNLKKRIRGLEAGNETESKSDVVTRLKKEILDLSADIEELQDEYDQTKLDIEIATATMGERKDCLERRSDMLFTEWWSWAKFGALFTMFTTAIACGYAALASQIVYAIKYPDYHIAETGVIDYFNNGECPTGKTSSTFRIIFGGLVLCVGVLCGLGTQKKYLTQDDFEIEDKGDWLAYDEKQVQEDEALKKKRATIIQSKKQLMKMTKSLSIVRKIGSA